MNKNSSKKNMTNLTIAFSCNGFPIASETFVIKQIVSAMNQGSSVLVHTGYKNTLGEAKAHSEKVKELFESNSVFSQDEWQDSWFSRLIISIKLAYQHKKIVTLLKSLNFLRFGKNAINLRLFKSISTFISSSKVDLVHAHFGPNGVDAVNAKKLGLINCPIITTFHGYDAHCTELNRGSLQKKYLELFSMGDLFIVNGAYLQNQLIDLGCPPLKIKTIPNSINTNLFNTNYQQTCDDRIRLICVGRLIELKNHVLAIESLSYLHNKGIKADLTIIGNGPKKEELLGIASDLGVLDHVSFPGNIDQQSVATALQESSIFLMTSKPDSNGRTESQGVVTLEAQASGLPVVALDTGGVAATVSTNKTGFLVNPDNPKDFFDRVYKLSQDEELRISMGKNAENFVHTHFSDGIIFDRINKEYLSLVNNEYEI